MSADDPDLLPSPPPPRPAARETAIEAAMRRFDGIEDKPTERPASGWQSWTRKPQFGLLVTASLVAVIGIPAALVALRTDLNPRSEYFEPAPRRGIPHGDIVQKAQVAPDARPTESPLASSNQGEVTVAGKGEAQQPAAPGANEVRKEVVAEPGFLAPPPPPAPRSVAAAPIASGRVASEAVSDQNDARGANRDELTVTGGLARMPSQQKASSMPPSAERDDSEDAPSAPDWVVKDHSYRIFLTNLQAAVRSGNRDAVIRLTQFPLRVNYSSGGQYYRNALDVRRDYDKIFTLRVRKAILGQRFDQLFGRDQGLMIGDGQVWFDHVCTNTACSPPGPVRIRAINP